MEAVTPPPTRGAPPVAVGTLSLLFLSGKEHGRKLTLKNGDKVAFGREHESNVVLADGFTSRRHARLFWLEGQLTIEDTGSTNGTFVNGIKVQRAAVKAGDHLLVGITTFEIVSDEPVRKPAPAVPAVPLDSSEWETTVLDTHRLISGSIKEIPVVDLLQLLATSRKSGVLTLRSKHGTGRIFLREGRLCCADINGSCAIEPKRTLYRLLRWHAGTFELRPLEKDDVRDELADATDSLLLEGSWHHDELTQLESSMPALDVRLKLASPLPGRMTELSPEELELVQLVLEHGVLLKVIDHFKGTDLDAYRHIGGLLKRKFIIA